VAELARAVRFVFVVPVLGFSYLAIRSSLSIASFEAMFKDMLGGKPLPALTTLVLELRWLFVAVALLVPALAIGCLFLRRVVWSLYLLGGLALVPLAETCVLYQALSAPLLQIVAALSGP